MPGLKAECSHTHIGYIAFVAPRLGLANRPYVPWSSESIAISRGDLFWLRSDLRVPSGVRFPKAVPEPKPIHLADSSNGQEPIWHRDGEE